VLLPPASVDSLALAISRVAYVARIRIRVTYAKAVQFVLLRRIERFRIGESSRRATMREQNGKRQDRRDLSAILTRWLVGTSSISCNLECVGCASKFFTIRLFPEIELSREG